MATPLNVGSILGAATILAAIGGVALDLTWPGRWYPLAAYGTAAVLAVAWIVASRRRLGAWVVRRSTRMGAHSALLLVVFVAILVMVNILVVRHPARLDLSQTGAFTLAPQTVKVLQGLQDDVKITAFFQKGSESEARFRDLLATYRHESPRIAGETIDPDTQPAPAKQYGITQYDTIVIESGGQEARIRSVSEEELTNALIRVGQKDKKRIAVLDGHGEPSITDADAAGFSQAKEALEKQGYDVSSLLLAQSGTIDPGFSVVIVADPQRPLLPQEISALKSYLSGGGNVLLLKGPGQKTGIEDLAATELGVTLRDDTVIDADPFSRLAGGDYTRPVVRTYGDHEIVRELGVATAFPLARSLTFQTAKSADVDYRALALTTQDSWGETRIEDGKARFDQGQDAQGPLDLAVAVTQKAPEPAGGDQESATPHGWRAVVVGNARFATNGFLNMLGNGDLLTSSINWLAQDEDLIAIRPKEASSSPLLLTAGQQNLVFWMPVVLVPGVITVFGVTVWRRRRRL
jgi:ABC-type uncharacterized transport system involved in gliding motility auxiliary subunit